MASTKHNGLSTATVEEAHPYIMSVGRRHVPKDRRRAIPEYAVEEGVRSRNDIDLPPPLLTVQELAVLLTTSSSGVYARVARGQIPGVLRIGRTLRFEPRVIARWLSANKASAGGLP
jgi:excisionase family DNA binding protein